MAQLRDGTQMNDMLAGMILTALVQLDCTDSDKFREYVDHCKDILKPLSEETRSFLRERFPALCGSAGPSGGAREVTIMAVTDGYNVINPF